MASILRYSTTAQGSMIFTGNTLGLLGLYSPPDGTTTAINANGIGAFISSDPTSTIPGGYPAGTTFDWRENGSFATLDRPTTSNVLYAELSWSGTDITLDQDVSAFIDNPINFTITTNTGPITFQVNPTTVTASEFTTDTGIEQYFRSADVTSIVNLGISGIYSVSAVPGALGNTFTSDAENSYLGWTLGVIYEDDILPYRNMSIWTLPEWIALGTTVTVPVSGFITPVTGPISSRILISGGEGDPNVSGDNVKFGPNASGLVTLSGPNNESNNFFASQINDGDSESSNVGQLDTSGSFGTANQPHPTTTAGRLASGRMGFDITNIDGSTAMTNSQTDALVIFSTTSDGYVPNLLGVQIDSSSPIIDITKTVDKSIVILGDTIAYTLNITNSGDIATDNFQITDTAPTGTSIIPSTITIINATGPIVNNTTSATLNIDIGPVNPSQTVIVNYILTTDENTTLPILNTANGDYTFTILGETIPESSTSNNVNTDGLLITAVKSGSPSIATLGDTIAYTVTITNTGNTIVNNVYFSDTLPEGTSLASGSSNPNPPSSIPVGSIGPGSTSIITFEVILTTLPINETIPNTGTVNFTYTTNPSVPEGTNGSTDTNTVITTIPGADISVAKSGTPSPVVSGNTLTYTMIVTNNGPSDATNVTLTDTVPPCLLNPQYSINGGVFSGWNGNTPLGNIVNGATVAVSIRGTVDPTCTGNIVNTAVVTTSTPDPTPGNNTSTSTIPLSQLADISVVKSGTPSPVVSGNTLTYTIIVTNNGPSDAQNVILTDTVPPCLLNPQYSINGGPFNPWNGNIGLGNIINGATVAVSIRGTVDPACIGTIVNTAVVTTSTPDPTTGNNTSTSTIPISPLADISVVKSGTPSPVGVGETLTYTIIVTNNGASEAQNVTLTDTIPPCLLNPQYSVNGGAFIGWNGSTPLGNIVNGATVAVSIRGTVDPACTGNIVNTAVVTTSTPDPTPGNNTSTSTIPLTPLADISVVKSGTPSPILSGNTLTYTIIVTNNGPSDATNVTLTDTVPTCLLNTQYSINGGALNPWNGNIGLGNIVNGATVAVNIRGTVDPSCTGNIVNTAVVTTSTPDPNPGDNTSTSTIPLSPSADISVVKTSNKDFVTTGDEIIYTITVSNAGPSDASNVVLSDSIPSSIQNPQYSTNGINYMPWLENINIGTVAVGVPQTIFIKGTISPSAIGTIPNTATITSPTPDPNPGNNTSTKDISVKVVDLTKVKSTDKVFADVGETITYTISVTNNGNTSANNVVIIDSIPNGTSLVSGSVSSNVAFTGNNPQTGIAINNPVSPGQTITMSFKVLVTQIPNPNPIPNTATINYTYTVDPANPNTESRSENTNTVTTQVNNGVITPNNAVKSASKNPTTPGDIITYTVSLTNTGNVPVNNVVINDVMPIGTTFVLGSVTVGGSSRPNENPNLGINVGTIGPNSTVVTTFKVEVLQGAPSILTNAANIDYNYTVDPTKPPVEKEVPTNKVDIDVLIPNITLVKSSNRSAAAVGEIIRYSIAVTNNGQIDLTNVIVTDTLPTEVSFNGNLTIDNVPSNQNITSGVNIGNLPIGTTKVVSFDAKVISIPADGFAENISKAVYDYTVTGSDFKGSGTSNEVVVKIYDPKLDVTKTANKVAVKVGDTFKYTINVKNTGDISVNNVIVTDILPIEFNVLDISLDGVSIGGNIGAGINIGTLALGQTKSIILTINVTGDLDETFKNIAIANGTAITDPNFPPVPVTDTGTDNVGVTVYNPKLDLVKSVDKKYVAVGDTVTYTITATNSGDLPLGNVELEPVFIYDILSPALSFVAGSVTLDGVSDPTSGIITGVDIGVLNVGESKTITFKATVISSAIAPIENNSVATFGYQVPGSTPQLGETTSNTVSIIPILINLDIVKTSDKDFAVLGDTITYTVKLTNNGDLDLRNVIFKDKLPQGVELINGSFKVNGVVINSVNLQGGVNIGNIPKKTTTTVQYSVKVVAPNCSMILINEASAKFNFVFPDATIGTLTSGPTSASVTSINLGIANFKQFSIEEYLQIPGMKPNIEAINFVDGKVDIVKCHIVETGNIKSVEGQSLTGYKLVIHGVLRATVEYTACEYTQSVHSVSYDIPFSTFIVLPKNYITGTKIELDAIVEDVYYKVVNCRIFFTNITVLINAKILSC